MSPGLLPWISTRFVMFAKDLAFAALLIDQRFGRYHGRKLVSACPGVALIAMSAGLTTTQTPLTVQSKRLRSILSRWVMVCRGLAITVYTRTQ
jgi:hypothetical protein